MFLLHPATNLLKVAYPVRYDLRERSRLGQTMSCSSAILRRALFMHLRCEEKI
jgi:hypothetical protein